MAEKEAFIRPGMNVDCVVKVNEARKSVDIRKAKVFDIDSKTMVLSQTTPAMPTSLMGQTLVVTRVSCQDNVRIGLSGKITGIVNDYQLSSSDKVDAITLSELSEEKQHNLRFAYRIRPAENCGLTLYNSQKEAIEVIDISAHGVRFSHDLTREYFIDQKMNLYIGFEQTFYELTAQVVRKERDSGLKRNNIEYVAVQFIDLDYRVEEELYKIVRNIEILKTSKRMFN
ncbi:PilZ domain-containing protein [Thermodesulfobacteriota bacterium]